MNKIVPLISSGTAGPLGVLHLPRLWLKVSLNAAGMLADGYPEAGAGYDQMVLDGLDLDRETTLKYLHSEKPTYPEFETWIKNQAGAKLDAASIEKLNASITGYLHDDETRASVLGASGIADDGSIKDAVSLNNIDDWKEFHTALSSG